MLILTRRPGEVIRIDENIKVILMKVKGNQVSLGIEAPKEIKIDREEIWQRKNYSSEKNKNNIIMKYKLGQKVYYTEGKSSILTSSIIDSKLFNSENGIQAKYLLKCKRPNQWLNEFDIFESVDELFKHLKLNLHEDNREDNFNA